MFAKPVDHVTKSDIDALVNARVRESRRMEYKQTLPGQNDSDKREYLADLSSFANHSGGVILYGLEAERDSSGKPTGAPVRADGLSGASPDAEILRLHSIADSGMDPRILGIEMAGIEGFSAGPVIAVRVPQSLRAPHMVDHNGVQRFWGRNSAGKYLMDADEIRASYLGTEGFSLRVEDFRRERVQAGMRGELAMPISADGTALLHVVPALHRQAEQVLTARQMAESGLIPVYGGASHIGRHNLDGFMIPGQVNDGQATGYVQVYRGGTIEAADAGMLNHAGEDRLIPSVAFERKLLDGTFRYVKFLNDAGVQLPYAVMLSLLRVDRYRMGVGQNYDQWVRTTIDRRIVELPAVLIDHEVLDVTTLARELRPIFDTLWQAAGWEGSLNYDALGNWVGQP